MKPLTTKQLWRLTLSDEPLLAQLALNILHLSGKTPPLVNEATKEPKLGNASRRSVGPRLANNNQ